MSILRHQCSTTWFPTGSIENPRCTRVAIADATNRPALRYSSPWPWALALAISVTIWLSAAWLIWTLA
jgi:hypothetical protein